MDLVSATKLLIKLRDCWEMQKIKISLQDKAISNSDKFEKKVFLFTNLPGVSDLLPMKMKKYHLENSEGVEWFWTVSLKVDNSVEGFKYGFKVVNTETNDVIMDRHHRRFLFKRLPVSLNFNEIYMLKGETKAKFDFLFPTVLSTSKITEKIFLGSCPLYVTDISKLKQEGIGAVLNLQTTFDMERAGVDWENLKNCYKKENIDVINFPILDIDPKDIMSEIRVASNLMSQLLDKNEKIYVHCTAGRNRSPNVVAYHLWSNNVCDLKTTIELIKSKRNKIKLSEIAFLQ